VLYSCVEDEGGPLGIGVQAQVSIDRTSSARVRLATMTIPYSGNYGSASLTDGRMCDLQLSEFWLVPLNENLSIY
jgi:hypothetical protein